MTETLNWDHTVADVTDLPAAIDYFNSKGLKFIAGGKHEAWGTEDARDYFGLNYLGLITVANPERAHSFTYENNSSIFTAVEDYFNGLQRFTTIAIRTNDIAATRQRLQELGLEVGEIINGERLTPTGNLIQWQMFCVNGELAHYLPAPFFIQWGRDDDSRRESLKSQGIIKFHPAGELFVKRAIFHVTDPQEAAKQWSAILQSEVTREGKDFIVRLGDKELKFEHGDENRLFKLIYHGAKESQQLRLGQIRLDLEKEK
ncbi:VOC family protein [Limosilactobacillus fastidiosus]|uniref:VOC family protein n=1 Tax=Limosilactobacillus fastidiosus TaxID=2759855 RepID=A0ABR6E9Y8_9LACO|nr:VOC family protein [Limosilactobacillus fastidiosus]MBB1063123.1 VOC family protein [Limosilactobacillus fastidiosus]MCD7084139.1 VOC family protein [Limosilactobacillus fastidiosus]